MTGMSDTGRMIVETAERVLAAHCSSEQLRAAEGSWSEPLWKAVSEAGLTLTLEPEGKGTFGIPAADALAVARTAGRFAAPVPLVEAMFGNWLLLDAGFEAASGVSSIAGLNHVDAVALRRTDTGWAISGKAGRVPWGRYAEVLVVPIEIDGVSHLALVPATGFTVTSTGENLAREPRDEVVFDGNLDADAIRPISRSIASLRALAAGLRVVQMAGALQALLGLTTGYAQERVQFGRPISKFQAVQQNIAIVGAQVAAARAAATMVATDFERADARFTMAAAKVRAGEAAGIAASYAHQVHGAIGFTQEYELHFLTKRLWSWRNEFGTEAEWARILGEEVCRRGADAMWPFIASGLAAPAPEAPPLAIALAG